MGKTYVILADGFEEIEALATVDLLRRAGIDTVTLSINKTTAVRGAHGIEVAADGIINPAEMSEAEMIVLPGGMPGAANLVDCAEVVEVLLAQHKKGGRIAAICAAPPWFLLNSDCSKGSMPPLIPALRKDSKQAVRL